MNIFLTLFAVLISVSCSTQIELGVHSDMRSVIEKGLFMSCPVYQGPDSVIVFLEKKQGFVRNKKFDFGNGSVRFNAFNATYKQSPLIDDKSLFLLNYSLQDQNFSLFQAIYYFESEEVTNNHYKDIIELLEQELKLVAKRQQDILGNEYKRYHLPDGSGFNLKRSPPNYHKHFIDIFWVPDIRK